MMRSCKNTWLGVLTAILLLAAAEAANAQGFMVKPMRMEVTAPAGQTIEIPLEIRNTADEGIGAIDVRLVELSQATSGGWRLVEPDSAADVSGLSSSLAWTSLSHSRVDIAPLEPAEVMVRLQVPPTARGFYFAGIVAETPRLENATGLVVRVRFLIPLVIEIQGRPVRQQVALDDVVMTYEDEDGARPTTEAHMRVVNQGQTLSRVHGQLRIERESEGRWRPVTRLDIAELTIIPGVTLELGDDLQRRLPSGTYRLRGDLRVDGRRIAPLEKEIAFEGDPNMDTLAYDVALVMEPDMVRMDVVPGATRTTALRIENPGDDPVTVRMSATSPRGLIGMEMGELRGAELSAEPWTEIRPAEFTIRPGGRQNVRVMSRVPRDGVQHANYYADLVLEGAYADGQSAGETRSTVQLFNGQIESHVDGMVERLSLAEGDEPGRYIVQMRFANHGTIHLEPIARAFLLTPQGNQVSNVALLGEQGPLLPLGKRTFSGEVNLSEVEPGYYALRSRVTIGPEQSVTRQQVLLVERETAEGGAATLPRITIVDPDAQDLPEGLDAPIEEAGEEPPVFTLEEHGAAPPIDDGQAEHSSGVLSLPQRWLGILRSSEQ